ncbi:sel1 repeat family protein [Streptomyces microflavus]|uniref:tetratricopeptide repeat protein n=1 Tax=Streptomyces microflavus TaxID=1919 RepID=UPI0038104B1E
MTNLSDEGVVRSTFCEDLRRLGALKKDRFQGEPTDRALHRATGASPSTVAAWLAGDRLPQRIDPVLKILELMRSEAQARGLLDDRLAGFLDGQRWRDAYRAEVTRRRQVVGKSVTRAQAHAVLMAEERRARLAALPDKPRPVGSWTAKRLGVHPAIAGTSAGGTAGEFVLPAYVQRPHDSRLRGRLTVAVAGREALLVVVRGTSCTGKTRTAYEAVRSVCADWDLLYPAGPDSLLAALAADAIGPRTVLWLNEAQRYLDGAVGEAAAAALLRRLDQNGPALVIATLWPEHDHDLTAAPDTHPHAQALLAQAYRTDVPLSFDGHDLTAVRDKARSDLSLAVALETGAPAVTQILAAGPDLIDSYRHPTGEHGFYSQALISAAMDARRFGITRPLPLAWLEAAAPGYLNDDQRSAADPDSWFLSALAHGRTKVKNVTSALQDVAQPTGMGALPNVVHLADYLEQHGRNTRRRLCPPASFWEAASSHLSAPNDLNQLAEAARSRLRYRHAATLYRQAADAGDPSGLINLARLREEVGDLKSAKALYQQAADAGDPAGLLDLARLREEVGDLKSAKALYQQAADAGDPAALIIVAELREIPRDRKEAEALARQAADAGDPAGLSNLARLRETSGDRESAEALYQQAADAGFPYALSALAELREKAGDRKGAEALARQAVEAGEPFAMSSLAGQREESGDREGAEAIARQAVEAGHPYAMFRLAMRRQESGDRESAEALYRQAGDAGFPEALSHLAELREKAGDREDAETLTRQAADAGLPYALSDLAELREKAGDLEDAEALYQQAADAGDSDAISHLTRLRGAGDGAGMLRYGLELDGTMSDPWPTPVLP